MGTEQFGPSHLEIVDVRPMMQDAHGVRLAVTDPNLDLVAFVRS